MSTADKPLTFAPPEIVESLRRALQGNEGQITLSRQTATHLLSLADIGRTKLLELITAQVGEFDGRRWYAMDMEPSCNSTEWSSAKHGKPYTPPAGEDNQIVNNTGKPQPLWEMPAKDKALAASLHDQIKPRSLDAPMDEIERIRCALAMEDAGYSIDFDHDDIAYLMRRYDTLRETVGELLKVVEEAPDNRANNSFAAEVAFEPRVEVHEIKPGFAREMLAYAVPDGKGGTIIERDPMRVLLYDLQAFLNEIKGNAKVDIYKMEDRRHLLGVRIRHVLADDKRSSLKRMLRDALELTKPYVRDSHYATDNDRRIVLDSINNLLELTKDLS